MEVLPGNARFSLQRGTSTINAMAWSSNINIVEGRQLLPSKKNHASILVGLSRIVLKTDQSPHWKPYPNPLNPPTQTMAHPTPIRILCFGASITAGWTQLGLRYHPYATTLTAHLQAAHPEQRFSVQVDGLPGDTVVQGQYGPRLRALMGGGAKYDWVIVQGGGNDLQCGREPGEIVGALREVWGVGVEAGARVVALTVTKTVGEGEGLARRYDVLNALIVGEECEGLYSVDVAGKLPPATVENVVVGKIYDRDGIHLGKKGYEMMGDMIASALLEIMRAETNGEKYSSPYESQRHT